MAAGAYNTEAFISAVRLRSMLPVADDGTSFPRDADILALSNQEMDVMLVPWILSAREGHLLTNTIIPLTGGVSTYTLPQRAAGAEVAFLTLVDSNGNPMAQLVEADLEVATQYPFSTAVFGQPTRYYFQGNQIVLVPAPADSTLSLKVFYPQRPNQIVPSTSVCTITSTFQVGPGVYTISTSGVPTTGAAVGVTIGGVFECVHAQPGFEVIPLGACTAYSTNVFSFAGTMPTGINVGDSLCLQDTANYPTNIPADVWMGVFTQWIAYKIAEIRRDDAGMKALGAGFKTVEKAAREYMGRRDKLGHRKISASASRGRRPLYYAK